MSTEQPAEPRPGVLARLDRRAVPALQRGAAAVVRLLGAPLRWLLRWEQRGVPGAVVRAVYPRRAVLVFVIALLAAGGSAVHLLRYPEIQQGEQAVDTAAREQGVNRPDEVGGEAEALAGGAQTVGPPVGAALPEYLEERQQALEEYPGTAEDVAAVVSFTEYRRAEAVAEALPGDVTAHLVQYRLPAEGEAPLEADVVGGDLVASMDRAIEAAREPIAAEEEELRRLLESDTVEEQDYIEEYQRRLEELAAVRNLLDGSAEVVFAVVVTGPLEQFRVLAERDDVRLVDPAPPETALDASVFYGVVPEDRETASYGHGL